jgi:HK97 gp10 family phage protein
MARHRVIGLRLTEAKLHQLGVNVEVIVPPTLAALARKVAEDASANLNNHRTAGDHVHVADDIKVGPVEKRGRHYTVKIGPSKATSWRARFLEWGTRHMGAIPFLRPARTKNRRLIKETIRAMAAAATEASRIG